MKTKIEEDKTLAERTTLSINAILEILKSCIHTTYFQVKKFYLQKYGMAIGFPLSPPLSDIFMKNFEKRALDQYNSKLKLWHKCVVDTLVIWQIYKMF